MGFTSRNPTKPRKKTISCLWRGRGREHTEQPTVFSKKLKRPPDSTSPGEGQARSSPSSLPVSPTGKRNPCQGPGPGTQDANPRKFHPEGVEGAPPHARSSGLQPHNSSTFRTKEGSCWGPNSPRPTRPTPARGNRSPEALPLAKTVGNEGLRLRAASRPVTLHFLTLCYRLFPFLPVRPRQRKWVNKVS